MKINKSLRAGLLLSGLLAVGFGAALLFFPAAMHANNGVDLGGNPSLLSEIRAPGGALLVTGVLIAAGAFFPSLTLASALISTSFYFAYGFSRALSVALDGAPAAPLVKAMVAELVLGGVGALLVRSALKQHQPKVAEHAVAE